MNEGGFTLFQLIAALATILSMVGGFVMLGMNQRKVRRENETDARSRTDELKAEIAKHDATVEKRLVTLESKASDFMARAEIEGKIEHEKTNRQTADEALRRRLDVTERDIVEIKVGIGRLDQKHDGMSSEMAEIKTLVKEQGKDTAARLEKIADQLAAARAA